MFVAADRGLDEAATTVADGLLRALTEPKGTPYDELRLGDPALSDGVLIDAMMTRPILINRPIVVTPDTVRLCRPSETLLDILPNAQRAPFVIEDGEAVVDAGGNRVARPAS